MVPSADMMKTERNRTGGLLLGGSVLSPPNRDVKWVVEHRVLELRRMVRAVDILFGHLGITSHNDERDT